jgi:hypothetical protein
MDAQRLADIARRHGVVLVLGHGSTSLFEWVWPVTAD